jgi:hypothetical protein
MQVYVWEEVRKLGAGHSGLGISSQELWNRLGYDRFRTLWLSFFRMGLDFGPGLDSFGQASDL